MIRRTTTDDIDGILGLYQSTASIPGGLARTEDEVTVSYVENFVTASIEQGLSLVVESDGIIVGEMHAYWPGLKVFHHVLSDLTICIHPEYQAQRFGRKLFTNFMAIVQNELSHITRVELIARQSNEKAIKFYQSLGFEIEGCLRNRIDGNLGNLENDIPMGWIKSGQVNCKKHGPQ
jgi:ribosomal protein S18 acetylase RimI-like enzyme